MERIKKGQSAIEFSLLVTFMFLMFTVFFVVVSDRLASINTENDVKLLEELGKYVQNEMRLAAYAVDGYYREFEIPQDLNGNDYEIIVQDYAALNQTDIIVRYANHSIDYDNVLPVSAIVSGSIIPKVSTMVLVRRVGGVVLVSNG